MSPTQMDISTGWCAGAHSRPRNITDYVKKEKIDFIEPNMCPQTSPILILLTMLFLGPFSKESTADENLTQWKN